jgi:CheY-like chemotaxis protein
MTLAVTQVNPRALPRILVVEPDDDARALYCQTLRVTKCEVVEASMGGDALTKALVRTPALVLTGLCLPLFDGYVTSESYVDRITASDFSKRKDHDMAKNIRIDTSDEARTPEDRNQGIPSPNDIARRAYDLYQARGAEQGRDMDDWLRAERELR